MQNKKPMARLLAAALVLGAAIPAGATLPIQNWETTGGARVLFVETHDLPLLDVAVDFAAGASRDAEAKAGLASLTRNSLDNGAAGLSEDEISLRLADVGAQLGGTFDVDRAGVQIRTLSSERERRLALDVLAKIIQSPEFPDAILQREKARVIAGLREAKTQAASVAEKALAKLLFGEHPYGRRADEVSVAGLTRDDVVNFYRGHYTSNNAVVAIIGDVSRSEAEAIADSLVAKLPQAETALPPLQAVKTPTQGALNEIAFPASQSHIVLGYPGLKRTDPDYYPLLVGNYILGGGGFSSRLTNEVREKRGLVYGVSSYFLPLQEQGPFNVSLQTRRDQTGEALQVVRETIRRFITDGPTERELQLAKQNLVGGFALRIDSNRKILDYLALIGFYRLPLTFLDDYVKNIEKVALAQIKEAFSRRIIADNMAVVVVGAPGDATQKVEAK
jgi:zinc protease